MEMKRITHSHIVVEMLKLKMRECERERFVKWSRQAMAMTMCVCVCAAGDTKSHRQIILCDDDDDVFIKRLTTFENECGLVRDEKQRAHTHFQQVENQSKWRC